MNKRAAAAPAITTVNLPALPDVPKTRLRQLKELTRLADELVERHAEIERAASELHRHRNNDKPLPYGYVPPAEHQVALNDYARGDLDRALALRDVLDPETLYEDDDREEGNLRSTVIAARLAMMLGSFPGGSPATPEVFVPMLLEHVAALSDEDDEIWLSSLALNTACAELEGKRSTVPSIATVLEVLREHAHAWGQRLRAMSWLPGRAARAAEDLPVVRKKFEAERHQRAMQDAMQRQDMAMAQRNRVRADVIVSQGAAAKGAQMVAEGFADLLRAEADVDNAVHDVAIATTISRDAEAG